SPPVPPASGVSGSGGKGGVGEPGAPPGAGPVNLNTADEATLDALPGVGPVTAAAIVAWRRDNGPFTDVEQLAEVDGIGPARLARLRTLVVV
ncbi:ComEA family DNA-binding protein, partial [Rhodococcus sp. ENV425]|uniref:ComEA family DNA-binding protein n=1 Tax=Rhodococcus sp. ENV425 TaxID=2042960 RepID=UPI002155A4B8